jgi:hypothetical protein
MNVCFNGTKMPSQSTKTLSVVADAFDAVMRGRDQRLFGRWLES